MKTHTTQWMMMVLVLLVTGSAMAQGRRNGGDREDRDSRGRGYHERNDDHHDDHYGDRHNDRYHNDHNHDNRSGNNRYDYPSSRYKPNAPHSEFRGNRPSPRHVWMPGEYRWRNGGYVYHSGYWMMPPRHGMHYVPGYWQPARYGGFVWISGFWSGGSINIRW